MKNILMSVALAVLSVWSSSLMAADEVRLLKAKSTETHYRNYWHSGRFEAIVTNLAYGKRVAIHLKKTDGTWFDLPLSYDRAASSGKEVWAADFDTYKMVGTTEPMEFAVKYEVNGRTYWDNNRSTNYRLKKDSGNYLVGTSVYNAFYKAKDYALGPNYDVYSGSVTVKNLGKSKDIQVLYTTDGWRTSKWAPAVYNPNYWHWAYSSASNPNEHGFEEWTFQMSVGTAPSVEYAVRYIVDGQTYWDNNFGRNYRTDLIRP